MKKSFVNKTILIFLLICVVPFSILMVFFVNTLQKYEQERIAESLSMITSEKAEVLKKEMESIEDNTSNLAEWASDSTADEVDLTDFDKAYRRNTRGILESPGEKSSSYLPKNINANRKIKEEALQTESLVRVMDKTIKENKGIFCAYLVTADGFMRVYPYLENSRWGSNHDQRTDSFYTIAANNNPSGEVKWTKPYYDYAGHGWITTCSSPYYVDGKMRGVVCIDVQLDHLTQSIVDFRIGNSGFAFLVAKSGEVIYHPDMRNLNEKMGTTYETAYGAGSSNQTTRKQILTKMKQKANGQINFREDSIDKVITYQDIGTVDWLVGLEIDKDDYAVDKGYLTAGVWVIIAVILFLALLFGGTISRRITGPILTLTKGVKEMAEGTFEKIPITSQDEIGMLGEAFNKMSEDLKEYTESLIYSKNQLESVFGSISDTIMIIGSGYQIQKINNVDAGDSHDQRCYYVLYGRTEPCKNCPVRGTLTTKKEKIADVANQSSLYQVVAYPVLGEDESLEELVVLEKNITEKRLMEKELFQTEKMAGVGQMVAGVTHELKNPLSVIKGASYLLRQNSGEDQLDVINEIDANIRRAETIVYQMLDFSRKSTGDQSSFNLRKILEQILLLIRQDCVGRKIVTSLDIEKDLCIWGDGDSFKHIFLNITANAIEAMPDGGELAISADSAEPDKVRIRIVNTGENIAEENLKQIFEPFYTTKEEGTGLGLWIVAKEVERNNGMITVQNHDGGVTTTVTLPAARKGTEDAEDIND